MVFTIITVMRNINTNSKDTKQEQEESKTAKL